MRLSLPSSLASHHLLTLLTYLLTPSPSSHPRLESCYNCTTIAVVKSRIAVRVGSQQVRPVMIDVVVSAGLGYFDLSGTKPFFFFLRAAKLIQRRRDE